MRGIIWRLSKLESEDKVKSTRPEGIVESREFDKQTKSFEDVIGIFLCIEKGDTEEYLDSLVKRVVQLNSQFYKMQAVVLIPFGHMSNKLETPKKAKEIVEQAVKKFKAANFETTRISFGTHKRLLWEIPEQVAAASYFEFPYS